MFLQYAAVFHYKGNVMDWTEKISSGIKGEFTAWKTHEVLWLILSCALVAGVSIWMKDSAGSFAAALSGILYTNIAGKGKRICYFFGVINSVCYAIISIDYRLYGEAMLYGGYYLPMMFVGFFIWNKKLNSDNIITKARLSGRERILWSIACILGIILYCLVLRFLNGRTPGLDSATNILSIAAMILTVKRCIEQWILWIIVNMISIIMWAMVWKESGDASGIVVMYIIFLISSFIFLFEWSRELKNDRK